MFVVKSIHIQINGQVMDLSIVCGHFSTPTPPTPIIESRVDIYGHEFMPYLLVTRNKLLRERMI